MVGLVKMDIVNGKIHNIIVSTAVSQGYSILVIHGAKVKGVKRIGYGSTGQVNVFEHHKVFIVCRIVVVSPYLVFAYHLAFSYAADRDVGELVVLRIKVGTVSFAGGNAQITMGICQVHGVIACFVDITTKDRF